MLYVIAQWIKTKHPQWGEQRQVFTAAGLYLLYLLLCVCTCGLAAVFGVAVSGADFKKK